MGQHKANVLRQRRRVMLNLYAAGHSLGSIAYKTGYSRRKVETLLRRAGVAVDPGRVSKPKEVKVMSFGNKRFDLEEVLERVEAYAPLFKDDTLDERIERHELTMTKLCEKGAIEEFARDRNLSYQDAFEEISHRISEVSDAYKREREEYAAEVQLARELGEEPPPSPDEARRMQEEEDREMFGVTNAEVVARAENKNISYIEALDELTDALAEKEQQEKAKEEQRRLEEFYEEFDRQLEEEESQA